MKLLLNFLTVVLFVGFVFVVVNSNSNDSYKLQLPEHFPEPIIPLDNPLNKAKIELGRHLFYDVNLSVNKTKSCATCHQQKMAFGKGSNFTVCHQ